MTTARAWCRVDLAGGTLDIWPLGLLHGAAATVNVAIDVAVEVRVEPAERYGVRQGDVFVAADSPADLAAQPDGALVGLVASALDLPPLLATLTSGSPRGGGLGASSAMTVALIGAAERAFALPHRATAQCVRLARDLEARLMALPTGIQDHYAALLGGALAIHHRAGGEQVRRLDVDLAALGDSLVVVYTGQSHFSAGQNWQVVRGRLDGDAQVATLFGGIAKVAGQVEAALAAGDLPAVGSLMDEEWRLRRQLAGGISTPAIERLLDLAAGLGAWGGKACGAGGGGCLALLCPPDRKPRIAAALTDAGGQLLAARPVASALALLPDDPPA
jgi:D-glycero-alpha-D-manno-heptose-7-phosphate kinase